MLFRSSSLLALPSCAKLPGMPNKAPLLLILGALSLLAGCGARRNIPALAQVRGYIPASSESRSPAGDWVVTSFTRPGEAFGGGYFLTDVLLKSPDSQFVTRRACDLFDLVIACSEAIPSREENSCGVVHNLKR